MKTGVLSKQQELKIINLLINSEYAEVLGAGSSRIVYYCPDEVLEFLQNQNINFNTKKEYVVKIGIGRAGFNQIQQEISVYDDYSSSIGLAYIPCAGNFVEIMEKVEVVPNCVDFYDYEEYFRELNGAYYKVSSREIEEKYNDDYERCAKDKGFEIEFTKDLIQELMNVADDLNDILGNTADNGQIGVTSDGRAAAYDFGFSVNEDDFMRKYTSDYSDYVSCREDEYLQDLYDVLTGSSALGVLLDEDFEELEAIISEYWEQSGDEVYEIPDSE